MRKVRRSPGTVDMLLLSLLAHKIRRSGYDLANALRSPVAFIFAVKHSQIYPALAQLERQGYISGKWVKQRGRPDKKAYLVTRKGVQHLKQWLLKPRTVLTQDEATLTSYNLHIIGPQSVASTLAIYRRQCEDERAQLEARWLQAAANIDDSKALTWIGVRSVYEYALDARAGRIAWCDWVAAKLRNAPVADERQATRPRTP